MKVDKATAGLMTPIATPNLVQPKDSARRMASSEIGHIAAGRMWFVHSVDREIEPVLLVPDDGGYIQRHQLVLTSQGSREATLKLACEILDKPIMAELAAGYTRAHLREDVRYQTRYRDVLDQGPDLLTPQRLWRDCANPAAMIELADKAKVDRWKLLDYVVRDLLKHLVCVATLGDDQDALLDAFAALTPIVDENSASATVWEAVYLVTTLAVPGHSFRAALVGVAERIVQLLEPQSYKDRSRLLRAAELCLWGESMSSFVLRNAVESEIPKDDFFVSAYSQSQGVNLGACKRLADGFRARFPWALIEKGLIQQRRARVMPE